MYLLLNKRKTKFLDDKIITLTKACFAATIKINLYEKWTALANCLYSAVL